MHWYKGAGSVVTFSRFTKGLGIEIGDNSLKISEGNLQRNLSQTVFRTVLQKAFQSGSIPFPGVSKNVPEQLAG